MSRKTPDMVKSNMKYKSAEKGNANQLSVPKTAPHRFRPKKKFIPFVENPELSQQENLRLKVEHFVKYNQDPSHHGSKSNSIFGDTD